MPPDSVGAQAPGIRAKAALKVAELARRKDITRWTLLPTAEPGDGEEVSSPSLRFPAPAAQLHQSGGVHPVELLKRYLQRLRLAHGAAPGWQDRPNGTHQEPGRLLLLKSIAS